MDRREFLAAGVGGALLIGGVARAWRCVSVRDARFRGTLAAVVLTLSCVRLDRQCGSSSILSDYP